MTSGFAPTSSVPFVACRSVLVRTCDRCRLKSRARYSPNRVDDSFRGFRNSGEPLAAPRTLLVPWVALQKVRGNKSQRCQRCWRYSSEYRIVPLRRDTFFANCAQDVPCLGCQADGNRSCSREIANPDRAVPDSESSCDFTRFAHGFCCRPSLTTETVAQNSGSSVGVLGYFVWEGQIFRTECPLCGVCTL